MLKTVQIGADLARIVWWLIRWPLAAIAVYISVLVVMAVLMATFELAGHP